ncbi:MAG: hypothetical protein ACYSUI_19790, partial [Planctomycetota bacterium]
MTSTTRTVGAYPRTVALSAIMAALVFLLGGCAGVAETGGGGGGSGVLNQNDQDDDSQSAEVIGLKTDVAVSGGQLLTVPYVVPTSASSVRAFYVSPGQQGDQTAWHFLDFGEPLVAGPSQFTIDSAALPRGDYLVGVSYIMAGSTQAVFSTGVLRVQGLPEPAFVAPTADVPLTTGETVQIIVDMGDPEGDVAWRVFFINDETAPAVEDILPEDLGLIGNELGAGTGNVANLIWSTESVALGIYRIGVSATDTGFSVAQTASTGAGDRIVTIYADAKATIIDRPPEPMPPIVTVTEPAANLATFLTETVTITFSAATFEGTNDEVTVFWDTERRDLTDFDPAELNAAQIIASELTTEDSSAQLSTEDLVEDVYHLGVYVDDGLNAPVAAYAPGQLSVTKTPTLAVTAPASGVIIRPSQQATVSWTTNVPATAAQTEVFVMADTNNDGVADGDKVVVRELNSDGSTSAIWEPTGQVGKFLAFVRLVFEDPSVVLPPDQAPGFIRVSTAPQIIWVGAFADPDEGEQSQGAILEGHQFEDNLGSAVSPAGDLDSDGSDDFLIAARYGKPFFANPEGIGHGAAYLIYGSHDRLRGRHNINTLGTGALRGVTFTGIRTPQGNSETDGLAVVTSIPDVDGDDNDELLFGFPEVDSRGHNMDPSQDGVRPEVLLDTLEKHDQFLRGGIVIVSSTSSILRSPDSDTPVINLDTVGQGFDVNCVLFEPGREDDAGMTIDAFSVDEATGECFGTDGLPNGGCDSAETDSAPDSTSIN